jgi:hypothetical protein
MARILANPEASSCDHLAHEHEHGLEECLRALHAPGWADRLHPLAAHMSAQGVVRAPGFACPPVRRLDLELLREGLAHLLRRKRDAASLIIELVVEGADPAHMAAERGVSRPVLVQQLRNAVEELAIDYEDIAYAGVVQTLEQRVRTALARKRG